MQAVVTGDADHGVGPHDLAGLDQTGVGLAHMHAVAAQSGGQIGAVVENHGDATGLGDRQQHMDGGGNDLVGHMLQADLQCRHISDIQGLRQAAAERGQIVETRRGDQVKAAKR